MSIRLTQEEKEIAMGLFVKNKKTDIPAIPKDGGEPVLRCSICTGEQVLCLKYEGQSELKEIMLIRSYDVLAKVCKANGIDPAEVRKVY